MITARIVQLSALSDADRERQDARLGLTRTPKPGPALCGHPMICHVAERDGTIWCRACTRG